MSNKNGTFESPPEATVEKKRQDGARRQKMWRQRQRDEVAMVNIPVRFQSIETAINSNIIPDRSACNRLKWAHYLGKFLESELKKRRNA